MQLPVCWSNMGQELDSSHEAHRLHLALHLIGLTAAQPCQMC